MKTQIHGGHRVQNLLRKAFDVKGNWKMSVDSKCPHKILTFFFSNTGHNYNHCMTAEDSKLIQEYMDKSSHSIIKEYLMNFKSAFSDYSNKLSLPPTCCWLLLGEYKYDE